jgi:hypothetical protein
MNTYTLDANSFFVFKSAEDIKTAIQETLGALGKVAGVERPYFTQYFTVQIEHAGTTEETVKEKILNGMAAIGYTTAQIVRVEGGETSTTVFKETVRAAADAVKPISSYVLILAVVVVVGLFLVLMLRGGKSA